MDSPKEDCLPPAPGGLNRTKSRRRGVGNSPVSSSLLCWEMPCLQCLNHWLPWLSELSPSFLRTPPARSHSARPSEPHQSVPDAFLYSYLNISSVSLVTPENHCLAVMADLHGQPDWIQSHLRLRNTPGCVCEDVLDDEQSRKGPSLNMGWGHRGIKERRQTCLHLSASWPAITWSKLLTAPSHLW